MSHHKKRKHSDKVPKAPAPAPAPEQVKESWEQIFFDDFQVNAQTGKFLEVYPQWSAYPYPWTDTSRNVRGNPGYYYPEKTISVTDGVMTVKPYYDTGLNKYLVAAPFPKLPKMLYGRFIVRLRADVITGYKIAPLLWPDSEKWPDDGEIDFPEGDLNGGKLSAFHHYARPEGGQDYSSSNVLSGEWHEYEIRWDIGEVTFLVDGKVIGSTTNYVPSKPMHWVLQVETQISSQAPPQNSTGRVQFDWVKVYRKA